MRILNDEAIKIIKDELDGSDMLNIFGLVNLHKVFHAVELYSSEPYTEEEVRHCIARLYDDEVTGGVQFKDENRRNPSAICGTCGIRTDDETTGYCATGHDNWVELRDFDNDDLKGHIEEACNNLQLTKHQLYNLFF
mgnify:CR=1 FL=1